LKSEQGFVSKSQYFTQLTFDLITQYKYKISYLATMTSVLVTQTQLPLLKVMDDIYELRNKQSSFLANVSQNAIWFNKSEKIRINEMQRTINKIPEYQAKIARMKQAMANLEKRVQKLKQESYQMKQRIGAEQQQQSTTDNRKIRTSSNNNSNSNSVLHP